MRLIRPLTLTVLAAVVVLLVAACGSDPTPTPKPAPAAKAPAAKAAPAPAKKAEPKKAAPKAKPAPKAKAKAAPAPKPSFDAAAHFKGKTIKIIVGFSPGGGYDTYARMVAAHLGDHMPGKPRTIVQNLPGGGGLRGLQAAMKADPDGMTVVTMANRWPAREAGGEDVEGFDPYTAQYVGTPSFSDKWQAFCATTDKATNWTEALALGKPVTTGTSAAGGDMIGPAFAEALGAPIKVIYGYQGTSEVLAAIDRGELDATTRCPSEFWLNLYPEWGEKKFLAPLFTWRGVPTEEELTRYGHTGGKVPHLFDIANPNEEQKAAFNLAMQLEAMTRMYTLPPGTPDGIVQAWRTAFKATLEDPKFIERAKLLERVVNYGDPKIMMDVLDKGKKMGDESRALFKTLYGI